MSAPQWVLDAQKLRDAEVDYALMVDAYEKQRTAAFREVNMSQALLADARHALTHGRLDVATEYLERCWDSAMKVRRGLRHAPDPS